MVHIEYVLLNKIEHVRKGPSWVNGKELGLIGCHFVGWSKNRNVQFAMLSTSILPWKIQKYKKNC